MTLFIVVAITALVALLAVLLLARGQRGRKADLDELRARLRPIDAAAFRNLIDENEEQFLRERLSGPEFRSIHRERMLAATEYVWCAARNAGIMMQLGEAAKSDADSSVAAAGLKLQDTAFDFRLRAYRALPRFYLRMLFPGIEIVSQSLADNCDRLSRQAVVLDCLQIPDRGFTPH